MEFSNDELYVIEYVLADFMSDYFSFKDTSRLNKKGLKYIDNIILKIDKYLEENENGNIK